MKRLFKTGSALLLALVLVLSLSLTAFAAGATVTYTGMENGILLEPGSDYTDTDLFGSFKGVMPGDQLSETIEIKNDASDCDYIKVYLRAQVHDEEGNPLTYSQEDTVANMADFLKQLTMRVYNGSELIYENTPDQAGALAENVLLGTLFPQESLSLRVELDVPMELDNEYANRAGEVDWVFLVEAFTYDKLTVHKVWEDNNYPNRPESVTVQLLRDGEPYGETVTLNEENQWTYTWDQLDELSQWSVEEADVPEGYEVTYKTEDNTTWIVNHMDYVPVQDPDPVDLTVKKVWQGDEKQLKDRPTSVSVTLYNGEEAVEKVVLSESNNWTYSWKQLDGKGDWSVLETGIPKGYTPSYRTAGDTVTITNTYSLIQTGQLNWPIPVLGSLGALMLLLGLFMLLKKRKNGYA